MTEVLRPDVSRTLRVATEMASGQRRLRLEPETEADVGAPRVGCRRRLPEQRRRQHPAVPPGIYVRLVGRRDAWARTASPLPGRRPSARMRHRREALPQQVSRTLVGVGATLMVTATLAAIHGQGRATLGAEVRIDTPPAALAGSDGATHLAYELVVTNVVGTDR